MTKPQILRFAFFCTPYTTTLSENETALPFPQERGSQIFIFLVPLSCGTREARFFFLFPSPAGEGLGVRAGYIIRSKSNGTNY
jgi:hypothetical protein